MKRVHVVENFLEDPRAEYDRALKAEYKNTEHRGLNYPGVAIAPDSESEGKLRKILGVEGGTFTTILRRYLPTEQAVTFIHNDCQIGNFSAILFLTLPTNCKGGVAFWKHRLYGWEGQPELTELAPLGLKDTPDLWKSIHKDGFDEFKWQMVDYVPMEFNRLVLFASSRYHSRYPKDPIGEKSDTCRMIKTFFFLLDKDKAEGQCKAK